MNAEAAAAREARSGLLLGLSAYVMWGLLPLYLALLRDVPALQVLSHRVIWSLALLVLAVIILRRGPTIWAAVRTPGVVPLLAASAGLIAINWAIYIWAVQQHHVLEASLGYFINPLVNVALGVLVLKEKLTRMQGAAVALAALGVLLLAASGSGLIWISLTLALSFSFYGLLRKVVAIDALGGLLVETALLAPLAIGWLVYVGATGTGVLGTGGARLDVLLVLAGAVTAAPLLLFAAAARKLRYATLGLLQYLAPSLQFVEAVTLFGETLTLAHIVTFGCIWAGCAVYAIASLREARLQSAVVAARGGT